jgi:hypothetical protein
MTRPRAADDFAAIRARLEELRRERSPTSRDAATEPLDGPYRRSLGRSPAPIDEQELLRRLRDRAPFSR